MSLLLLFRNDVGAPPPPDPPPITPPVSTAVFGVVEREGAEALARKTIANRKQLQIEAENALIEAQNQAAIEQKQAEIDLNSTQSTPSALKAKRQPVVLKGLNLDVVNKQNNTVTTYNVSGDQVDDEFDIELVMMMLLH